MLTLKPGQIGAWLLLAAIAVVTLAPIGWRPETALSAQVERFVAFGLIGLVFSLAYPRRLWLVALMILGAAIGLELAQLLVQTRHAGVKDVVAKLAGGGGGLVAGWMVLFVRRRRSASE